MTTEQDSVDILSQLLDEPVAEIMVGDAKVKIYPVGLPEQRDLAKKFREMGVNEGDNVDIAGFDFLGHVFWLLIRQGTSQMTPERVRREDWEVPKEAGTSLMGLYGKAAGEDAIPIIELAQMAGLFSKEDDEEGEADGGETPPLQQPNEKGEDSDEPQ